MKISKKWPWLYGLLLLGFTIYVLLDIFVIPRRYATITEATAVSETKSISESDATSETKTISETKTAAENETAANSTATTAIQDESADKSTAESAQTATTSNDGTTSVTMTTYNQYNTTIYVADVVLSSADALQTAFAENTYGRNITAKTSAIASAKNALLAINGDYYSARTGYVIRNGVIYRDTSTDDDQEDLVIYEDGSMAVIREGDYTAEALLADGAMQVFCFGPGLVVDSEISVSENDEVDQAMTSNPRTAIGWIDDLHYVLVVADGRTSESEGLSLYELATFMSTLGVNCAYNLDGGGSSTMYYEGAIINKPTTNGNSIKERSVSDIIYIQ